MSLTFLHEIQSLCSKPQQQGWYIQTKSTDIHYWNNPVICGKQILKISPVHIMCLSSAKEFCRQSNNWSWELFLILYPSTAAMILLKWNSYLYLKYIIDITNCKLVQTDIQTYTRIDKQPTHKHKKNTSRLVQKHIHVKTHKKKLFLDKIDLVTSVLILDVAVCVLLLS